MKRRWPMEKKLCSAASAYGGGGATRRPSLSGFAPAALISGKTHDATHMPSHGGGSNKGAQIERENPGLSGSGRPRAAGKPLKKVGGFAPHLFEGFPGRPGPPRPTKSRFFPLNLAPLLVPPPCEGR